MDLSESQDSMNGDLPKSSSNPSRTARMLTNTSTLKEKRPTKPIAQKKSWMKIQEKTESLMKQKSVHHRQSFLTRTVTGVKKPKFDRRHHITAQIDAIRAEQADKLYAKEQARKKKLELGVLAVARTFTINPKSTWKQTWDIGILMLVIFSAVYIPVVLALPDMTGVPSVLQASFDFAFLLDFFMCFRTGFIRPDNEIELNQAKIVQHYLGSWFTIDILASFPLDYILVLFNNSKLMVL